jgi:S1-C subfamily serine protease
MEPVAPRVAALAVVAVAAAGCGSTSNDAAPTTATVQGAQMVQGTRAQPGPLAAALTLQSRFERVVRDVSPSVVLIETAEGLGSGVVYDGKGDIVTNAHVVGNAKTFTVTLASGRRRSAVLVGTFPAGDLAVIRLEGGDMPAPARFADSAKTKVGEIVLAIGNPLGLRASVTQGIVSSVGRTVSEGNGVALASAIQTSAAINPGNSGGALVDLDDHVVGIPTLAALDPQMGGGQAPGIGFAIPSNTVRKIAGQLVAEGRVVASGRAFLGIEAGTAVNGGVYVAGVEAGGPAARAGLRRGDRIVAVDHRPVLTTDDLATVLATLKPGQRVAIEVVRADGRKASVEVRLGQLSSPPGTP